MSAIISILKEAEIIMPPAEDRRGRMEAYRKMLRQEALVREFVPGGRREPRAVTTAPDRGRC
jgi:hypothetical protein